MLLQSNEVAKALNADQKTVLRWIRDDRLPARRVDGEFQSDPVELLEWATERGIKVNPSLYKYDDADHVPLPALSEALQRGGIHAAVAGSEKETVLRAVVDRSNLPPEADSDFILQLLMGREGIGSTAIGDGIAIPHTRNPALVQLSHPVVSLSRLDQPLDFGAPDGKPVGILFTVFCSDLRGHLHLLSEIAFCVADAKLREALGREWDPEAIISAIRDIESGMTVR